MEISRFRFRAAAFFALLAAAGCGRDTAENSREQMHKLFNGLLASAQKNTGAWPDRLDQVKPYVGGDVEFALLIKNPLTGDSPGYEYAKPPVGMYATDLGQYVILYQLRGGQRDLKAKAAYADGSVRVPGGK